MTFNIMSERTLRSTRETMESRKEKTFCVDFWGMTSKYGRMAGSRKLEMDKREGS